MNEEIRDIKPPLDIPNAWGWIWPVLGLLLLVIAAAWVLRWYLKRPKAEKKEVLAPISSWERAYARLDSLRAKGLMERAYLKPFYSELSDIIRQYLEERFAINAPEMTTEEFLGSLKTSPVLNDSQQQLLKEFLLTCDMVKFAKFQPTQAEAQNSYNLARLLVDRTHGT
jgi:hypothetical protein